MKYYILLIPSLLVLFFACRNSSTVPSKPVSFGELPADFRAFYEKFHTDSAFQMTHIEWPLRGETSVQADSAYPERRLASWEPAQWSIQHAVDFRTGEFKGEWEMLGEEFVLERIKYAAANYGLERHFIKREDGEWQLLFYADMQEMGR